MKPFCEITLPLCLFVFISLLIWEVDWSTRTTRMGQFKQPSPTLTRRPDKIGQQKAWRQHLCLYVGLSFYKPCSWLLTSVCRAMAASTLTGISWFSIRLCLSSSTAFLSTKSLWKCSRLKQCNTQQDWGDRAETVRPRRSWSSQLDTRPGGGDVPSPWLAGNPGASWAEGRRSFAASAPSVPCISVSVEAQIHMHTQCAQK